MNLSEEFFSGPGGTKEMNLEKNFILREMAGEYVIIPTGKRAPVQEGLLTVNEVGAALWKELERGADFQELLASVLAQYEVEEERAVREIREFLDLLRRNGILTMEEDEYRDRDHN